MTTKIGTKIFSIFLSLALMGIPARKSFAFPAGSPVSRSGSPLDSNANCTGSGCHASPNATTTTAISLSGLPATWTAGQVVSLSLTVTGSGSRMGFEISAENSTAKKGTFAAASGTNNPSGNTSFLTQSSKGSSPKTWTFNYTFPAAGAGTIYFYIAACAGTFSSANTQFTRFYSVAEGSAATPPTTTTHPSNQSVTEGSTANFTVAATGAGTLSYQWQKAPAGSGTFTNISAATLATYTTPATVLADSTSQFRCVITNSGGSTTSNAASLTVTPTPPSITTNPTNQTVIVGQTATLSVGATGSATLNYQWQMAPSGSSTFSNVIGATASSYTTPITIIGDNSSQYKCVVTNTAGSATSNAATLTVSASAIVPSISAQPSNKTVVDGATANFSVTAAGTNPLGYQWQKAPAGSAVFNNISLATSASYTTPATTTADSGSQFKCVITNNAGSITSNAATLTITPVAPTISSQPANQSVTAGSSATFSVAVSGSSPFTYQWQSAVAGSASFSNIGGAVLSSYTTPAVTAADDGKQLKCVVSNAAGSTSSGIATLSVPSGATTPAITTQPSDQYVMEGSSPSFAVEANSGGADPLTFKWFKNGSQIVGETNTDLTLNGVKLSDDGSIYSCIVTNSANLSATSNSANIKVAPYANVPAPQLQIASAMSAADMITVTNRYLSFKELRWTIAAVSPIANAQNPLGVTSAQATTGNYTLNLASLNLIPGQYSVSVVAVLNNGSFSAATTATTTLMQPSLNRIGVQPNPWVADRDAQTHIVFSNLTVNAVIKITSRRGELIKTLIGTADTISWDLRNENGGNVPSGVYLFTVTDAQGHTYHSKLVIVK